MIRSFYFVIEIQAWVRHSSGNNKDYSSWIQIGEVVLTSYGDSSLVVDRLGAQAVGRVAP